MISFRYYHADLIARYIWRVIASDNLLLLLAVLASGMAVRAFTVLGLIATLQSIVAAIKPMMMVNAVNKGSNYLGVGYVVDSGDVVSILIIAILFIFGLTWVVQAVHSKLVGRLNFKCTKHMQSLIGGQSVEFDAYIIDRLPALLQAVTRCCDIALFILLILIAISILVPKLGLLVLPAMVAALVLVEVFRDRGKLRREKELWDARHKYNTVIARRAKKERVNAADEARALQEFQAIRENQRHRAAVQPQIMAFIGAVAICAIIYNLFTSELELDQLAGMLIVVVVGIRYVIRLSRELSTNFSRILELRSKTEIMRAVLEPDPAAPDLQNVGSKSENVPDGSWISAPHSGVSGACKPGAIAK